MHSLQAPAPSPAPASGAAPPRRRAHRGLAVLAAWLLLSGPAFVVAGVLLLGADRQRDADGFFSTDAHTLSTGSRALSSADLDLDFGPGHGARVGTLRLRAAPSGGKPLFVGLARTSDVREYLRGVAHTEVADFDTSPFRPRLRDRPGAGLPRRPAQQGFWAASSEGAGRRSVVWDVRDGHWSAVVMNADGSPGVAARTDAGLEVTTLAELGVGALAIAAVFAAAGVAVAVLARR